MGQYGWGKVQEEDLLAAVRKAVDIGINFFDTADTYGLGTSERNLAKAFGNKRKDVVIADKFGVRVETDGPGMITVLNDHESAGKQSQTPSYRLYRSVSDPLQRWKNSFGRSCRNPGKNKEKRIY